KLARAGKMPAPPGVAACGSVTGKRDGGRGGRHLAGTKVSALAKGGAQSIATSTDEPHSQTKPKRLSAPPPSARRISERTSGLAAIVPLVIKASWFFSMSSLR